MKDGVIERARRSEFLHLFTKTPRGIVCPHFFVLSHANGCPFQPGCLYCYLWNTFRTYDKNQIFSNIGDMEEEVKRHLQNVVEPSMINTGELSDSLVWEKRRPIMPGLIELFRGQKLHQLLLLTKSDMVEPFAKIKPADTIIFSFSVNRPDAARDFEPGVPSPERRLAAAAILQANGWRIRLRLDPMMRLPREKWVDTIKAYVAFAGKIASTVKPERITLGTIRFFQNLPNCTPEGSEKIFALAWDQGDPDRRRRYPLKDRVEIYSEVVLAFRKLLPEVEIGLCKETESAWEMVWETMGKPKWFSYRDPKCNCAI